MIVRLAASATIMVGCGLVGIFFASALKKRVYSLEEFQNVIKQLEFDIEFLNTPIGYSLKRIGGMFEGGVGTVIKYISMLLEEQKCADMHNIWKKALERFGNELYLNDDDKKIILDFSKTLGCGDRTGEKNNIRATLMRLKVAEEDARTRAATNAKMYRGLGFLTGIFIVIVLL